MSTRHISILYVSQLFRKTSDNYSFLCISKLLLTSFNGRDMDAMKLYTSFLLRKVFENNISNTPKVGGKLRTYIEE